MADVWWTSVGGDTSGELVNVIVTDAKGEQIGTIDFTLHLSVTPQGEVPVKCQYQNGVLVISVEPEEEI